MKRSRMVSLLSFSSSASGKGGTSAGGGGIGPHSTSCRTKIPRSVAVYGAISVVTDGEKVIIYQKLERKGSHGEYDIYRLEPSGKSDALMYQAKHV